MKTKKPRARLYRFDNGHYGVQKRFLCFWYFLSVPTKIGQVYKYRHDMDFPGVTMYYVTTDKYKALRIVKNINLEGPVY